MKQHWKDSLRQMDIPFEEFNGNIYLWNDGQHDFPYTERMVYQLIRAYRNSRKRYWKKFTHDKNRMATSKAIHDFISGSMEDIFSGMLKVEDRWNWD